MTIEEQVERKRKEIIADLSQMSLMTASLAYMYAHYIETMGVDVTEKWETALQNNEALTKAFNRGYYEALRDSKKELSQIKSLDVQD